MPNHWSIVRFALAAAPLAALLSGCTGMPQTVTGAHYVPAGVVSASIVSGPDALVLQTLDVPLSQFPNATGTVLTGIRDRYITGFFTGFTGDNVGLVYDRTTGVWTRIRYPHAAKTSVYGPAVTNTGYRLVGSYQQGNQPTVNGFVYDSTSNSYQTLDAPANLCAPKACNYTIVHSNYGDAAYRAVGNYDAVSKSDVRTPANAPISGHAFLYDSTYKRFTTIDVPGAASTTAYGIWMDGNVTAVAGGFADKTGTHAYVRTLNGKHMLVYDAGKTLLTHFEGITGVVGAGNYNVIGDYTDVKNKTLVYGFFLPIRNWTAGTPTMIGKVSANSVFGRTVIGVYEGAGLVNGYITTIP
jgi:hypothetical protein